MSRVLDSNKNWTGEIEAVFEVLERHCHTRLTPGCSMHVHVSPDNAGDSRYTLNQLKGIMKAVFYFDDALTRIMPADRKVNEWAKSNVRAKETKDALKNAYAVIPQKSWTPLFKLIDSIKFPQLVHPQFGSDRYMSWNFGNVTDSCGTVEFRRPPGVDSVGKAKHWAAITLAFVSEPISTDWSIVISPKSYPSVTELQQYICIGAQSLARPCWDSLDDRRLQEIRPPRLCIRLLSCR